MNRLQRAYASQNKPKSRPIPQDASESSSLSAKDGPRRQPNSFVHITSNTQSSHGNYSYIKRKLSTNSDSVRVKEDEPTPSNEVLHTEKFVVLNELNESDGSNSEKDTYSFVKFPLAVATPVGNENIKPAGHYLKNKLINSKQTPDSSVSNTQEGDLFEKSKAKDRPKTTKMPSNRSPTKNYTHFITKKEDQNENIIQSPDSKRKSLLLDINTTNSHNNSYAKRAIHTARPSKVPLNAELKDVPVNIKEGQTTRRDKSKTILSPILQEKIELNSMPQSVVNSENRIQLKSLLHDKASSVKQKLPVSEVYDQILKKHLGGNVPGLVKPLAVPEKKTTTQRPATSNLTTNQANRPFTAKVTLTQKDKMPTLQILQKKPTTTQRPLSSITPASPENKARTEAKQRKTVIAVTMTGRDTVTSQGTRPQKKDPKESQTSLATASSNNSQAAARNPQHLLSNFKYERVLGQGAYAVVKLALDKARGEHVAAKIYEKSLLMDPRRMKNVRREISILQEMQHPNIIRLLDSFDTPKQIHVIMEYVGKTSLHSFLRSLGSRRLTEDEIRQMFGQICAGVSYCHQKNVIHRDIKLENILIDNENRVKILDFGFSIYSKDDQRLNIYCGTPSYMAPEIVTKTLYRGAPTDVWALGIILFILLSGHFPFRGQDERELFAKIKKGKLEFPDFVSEGARKLVQKILRVNPDERLRVNEILESEWLQG